MSSAWLERANAYVQDRVVRAWQHAVFTQGELPFADWPVLAGLRFAGTLYFSPPKAFGYCFTDGTRCVWVFTGGAAGGYEIEAVLDGTALWSASGEPSGLTRHQAETARRVGGPAEAPSGVQLLIGQTNFAHLLWNELPALIAAETWAGSAVTRTVVTNEPIAPVGTLLRWPHGAIITTTEAALTNDNPPFHPSLLFALGSALVTPEAKARVRNASRSARFVKRGRPVLWISLRLMYRHPVNQCDAFLALFRMLDDAGAEFDVLFDGFSLPADVDEPGRYPARYYHDHAARVRALGAAYVAELRAARFAHLRFQNVTVANLPESIALAAYADYYVCNQGTQQHKIGWLYDTPGIIHANARWSRNEPNGIWVSTQAASPVLPVYVPAGLIEECPTDNERQDDESFRDYRFTDPAAFAAFVLADMRRVGVVQTEVAPEVSYRSGSAQ